MKHLSYLVLKVNRRRNLAVLGALYFICLIISYVVLILPGSTYVKVWITDVMALLNGVNRVYQGQIPSIDFHSLYGPLVYYIPALGLHAGFELSTVFPVGGVLVAAFLLLAAWLTMYSRFSLLSSVLTTVFLWLLIVAPVGSGNDFDLISWGTYYNRHGWAAVTIALLHYVKPQNATLLDRWVDTFVLSALTLFALYTKITFGLVALAFIFCNMFVSKYHRDVSKYSIVTIIIIVAILELIFEFHMMYIRDIFEVTASNSMFRNGTWGIINLITAHAWVLVACGGVLLITLMLSSGVILLNVGFILSCIIVSIMLLDQSGGTWNGLQALIAVFICCGELARRAEAQFGAAGSRHYAGTLACFFLVLMFISEPVLTRTIVMHDYYTKTAINPLPGLPAALSGFRVPVSDLQDDAGHDDIAHETLARYRTKIEFQLFAYEYLLTIIEGVDLIKTVNYRGKTLLVLDHADPFSLALELKPTPNGRPLLYADSGIFTSSHHPSGQEMFSGVDYVMAPVLPYSPATFNVLTGLYGDYLNEKYVEVKRSLHWRLLAQKPR